MSVSLWRSLKALLSSSLLAAVALLSIRNNADPTVIGVLTLVGILLMFGIELKELQLANFLSVTFKKSDDDPNNQDE